MATRSVNDVNLQPVEAAVLLNLDNREAYETAVRTQTLGLNNANFTDRDGPLYGDPHRSPTANLS